MDEDEMFTDSFENSSEVSEEEFTDSSSMVSAFNDNGNIICGSTTAEANTDRPRPSKPSSTSASASVVWNYFTRKEKEAKCSVCDKMLKVSAGSTSSLIRHLGAKHPTKYKDFLNNQKIVENLKQKAKKEKFPFKSTLSKPKQPKVDEFFKANDKWSATHPKAKEITKAIGTWMAKSLHPYSLVEEQGFVNLIKITEPKYSMPNRTTFSRSIIPELYQQTKAKVSKEITQDINGATSMSVTTDLWTSAANDAFISASLHYIDKDFELKTFCLGSSHFPEEHTGRLIAAKLLDMVEVWGIKPTPTMKIFCITDNAKNIVNAISLTNWTNLRCFAHTLQLTLVDAKKDVAGMTSMLAKARAIVGHYKHSATAQFRLCKIQDQLGNRALHLIQDCETRWNSEFKMLSRLLELKQAISAELVSCENVKVENLNATEWDLAEGYVRILRPFDEATTLSSGSSLPTLSTVLPMIDGLKSVLNNFITSKMKGIMFARALQKAMLTRFPESYTTNKTVILSMVVDPRFKVTILKDFSKTLATNLLKEEALSLYTALKKPTKDNLPSTSTSDPHDEEQG